ncbi:MAG: ImmA/IrrE family metallo-endopeptidase [Deltaproteobacteria bacterium]|nr:ImmA/IrrE family metallo-endopeptidase [Chloroflexota bacterium]MBM4329134.1 ImmA/IrrE family metallo-endopeptidase [Deltaproteobacteria bacterium]MBM4453170.1 ImmA/IrrE family metallo-endopeptidase [Chloroflexota bacterium]
MAGIRVEVSPKVLSWAAERTGVNLQRKFPHLGEWLSGVAQPTLRQLEEFAKVTSVPFGYLFLPEPPEERSPIPHFRTVPQHMPERLSADLMETIQIMQRRQAWMREYLIEQGHEPVPIVGSASVLEDPSAVARQMCKVLEIGDDWAASQRTWTEALSALKDKAEDSGILLVTSSIVGNNTRRKLSVEEFRGFVLVDEYAPLVFINGSDGKAAQMFTLAHELAHVWLGRSASFDLRDLQPALDETEQVCNRISAEFLVPGDSLRQFWSMVREQTYRFQAVARKYKVSEIVAARRALDLRLIERDEFFYFYEEYQQRERQKRKAEEGGNFYATQNLRLGQSFGQAVILATREGRLLYDEAYRLTGLYGRTFERYAELVLGGRW